MKIMPRSHRQRLADSEGVAAVEFAIILSVFLMIVMGILEFGYDWYLRNALANASREGCRWGVMYRIDAANNWLPPSMLPPGSTIQDVVNNYLTPIMPRGTTWTTTPSGTGYTNIDSTIAPGLPLTVTVSTTKTWSVLGNLVPGLHLNNMTITVQTTMRVE